MKHIVLFLSLLTFLPAVVWTQERDLRAERIVVDDDNGNTILIQAPATGMTGSWTFTLPPAAPSAAGQVITSDGSGGYAWQAPAGGGGSIPVGFMIIGSSPTVPSGYTAAGTIVQKGTDAWFPRATMPTPRTAGAVAEVGGKVYVVGGVDDIGTPLATNEEYDPVTNTWASKASMGTARHSLCAASTGGFVYIIGGRLASNAPTDVNERYDPSTNTWATRAVMPTARRDLGADAAGGKVYVLGGRTNTTGTSVYSTANEEYDPATNTWAAKAAIPVTGLRDIGVGSAGGKIYMFGGSGTNGAIPNTREYNPGTNTWTSKAPLPFAQNTLDGATLGGYIYVAGNNGNHYRYDVAANTWDIPTSSPSGWSPFPGGYVTIGSTLYAFGSAGAVFQYVPATTLYLFSKN
ncbi:MAG: Kelch repeat-containing protein [Candidatus Kapaibacterium sp.]